MKQSFVKEKLHENPQEQFRKDIDEVIKNSKLSKSTRESTTPSGSDRIPIFYVIYLINCKKCNIQYVRQTQQNVVRE